MIALDPATSSERRVERSSDDTNGGAARLALVILTNVRKDGLEIFFDSNRAGSSGGSSDLWTSTRASTTEPWSPATNLGTDVNSIAAEGRPSLSFDGQTMYFMSSRPGGDGGLDLYMTTRVKVGDGAP